MSTKSIPELYIEGKVNHSMNSYLSCEIWLLLYNQFIKVADMYLGVLVIVESLQKTMQTILRIPSYFRRILIIWLAAALLFFCFVLSNIFADARKEAWSYQTLTATRWTLHSDINCD